VSESSELEPANSGPGRDDATERLLERLHDLLMRNPLVTQSIFRTLAAEGRRFARTPEGEVLAEALAGSDLVQRGRMIWEVLTLSSFAEEDAALPSVLVQELRRAVASQGLEPALSRLFERRV
jgi:hypothetical protein